MSNRWQVGIDIGGTFTDIVAFRPADGAVRTAKVATMAGDMVGGLVTALGAVGLQWPEVADLIHGTTMVTNAIVEDELAEVALIATRGFADTLAIGRQNRLHLYRLDLPPKAKPQVPAQRRFAVAERLDHEGRVLEPLSEDSIAGVLGEVAASGAQAVAVSLLHSYANPAHEEALGKRLRERFSFVALSNRVNPEAREYERTATTVLSASVMPMVAGFLDRLEQVRPAQSRLHLFHSAGGMASPESLRELPLGLALSGPAAGVAAACRIAQELDIDHAISFDMGGTTTDVCLIVDGEAQVSSERSLAERPLRQPMVAVESIGAGGGSIARFDEGALCVGPESAGAEPGPACYRRGGSLPTVTDANLVLGYMDAERVIGGSLALNVAAAREALAPLAARMDMSIETAALGVVRVVNSAMVRALRRITVERGIDGRQCALLAYGGAGPMHAVEVARAFGIGRIIVPNHSSAFSALGCVSARMSYSQQRTVRMAVGDWDAQRLQTVRESLQSRLCAPLQAAGHRPQDIALEEVAAIRYRGQSYAIEIANPCFDDPGRLGKAFFDKHEKLYGFATAEPWELVAIRQRASVARASAELRPERAGGGNALPKKTGSCTFDAAGAVPTPRYSRAELGAGQRLTGPAVVEDAWSTVIVPPGASLSADGRGHLHIEAGSKIVSAAVDPVTLEVIRNALNATAEEMSLVVMRSARSPLLREAGDLSSALTDAEGRLIAQGRDIPMHVGVMSFTVAEFLKRVPRERLAPGDVWFLNLPEVGGNHLPDVKAIRPVFVDGVVRAFAVSLAHWADIGGAVPGSYVAGAVDAWQEGLRMPPFRLFSAGGPDREKLDMVLANVRGAPEREGDILAQMAATRAAEERLHQLFAEHGTQTVIDAIEAIHDRAEAQMRAALRSIPDGTYVGEDWLDDDGAGGDPVAVRVRVTISGDEASFDFSDTADAARGPVNTTPFIAAASVFYVVKALFGPDIQPSGGCYRPLKIVTRPGSLLEPDPGKPVVGGNHETSQRVADAVFRALEPTGPERLSAGGPTTSGLVLFGGRRADGVWTTLYETHGGGEGARHDRDGAPVIRVHMSNVMNTPAEVIEAEYPIRVECQRLRGDSGGAGRHRGGEGLHREYRVLCEDMSVTSMFERRVIPPYGLQSGESGAPFKVTIVEKSGRTFELPGKANIRLGDGDLVVVDSCGGGGYGPREDGK